MVTEQILLESGRSFSPFTSGVSDKVPANRPFKWSMRPCNILKDFDMSTPHSSFYWCIHPFIHLSTPLFLYSYPHLSDLHTHAFRAALELFGTVTSKLRENSFLSQEDPSSPQTFRQQGIPISQVLHLGKTTFPKEKSMSGPLEKVMCPWPSLGSSICRPWEHQPVVIKNILQCQWHQQIEEALLYWHQSTRRISWLRPAQFAFPTGDSLGSFIWRKRQFRFVSGRR